MSDLVVVHGNFVLTDSQIVAKVFEMKHREVMYQVENVLKDFPRVKVSVGDPNVNDFEYVKFIDREYRGTKFKAVIFDKGFLQLIVMRFTTERAKEQQLTFSRAFTMMERELAKRHDNLEWKTARLQSVKQRRVLTDTIKDFVEYATNQGSKSASRYYGAITMMEYTALELLDKTNKLPDNFRDTLDVSEVSILMGAEEIAKRAIAEGMRRELHYKDIYTFAKTAVIKFADSFKFPKMLTE